MTVEREGVCSSVIAPPAERSDQRCRTRSSGAPSHGLRAPGARDQPDVEQVRRLSRRSLRSDGHNLARGPLAPMPHLAQEKLRELAASLEHCARGGVHQLRVGDFGHAGHERGVSGRERARTDVDSCLVQPCAAGRCSRILGLRRVFCERVRVPSTPLFRVRRPVGAASTSSRSPSCTCGARPLYPRRCHSEGAKRTRDPTVFRRGSRCAFGACRVAP